AFGDPAPGSSGKVLRLTYNDGKANRTIERPEGTTLQIGPRLTAIVPHGGGLMNLEERLAELRKHYPTGLVVLDAEFGTGNRWTSVTDLIQSAVSGDSLTVPIGHEAFGDPAPGSAGQKLKMTYADDAGFKSVTRDEGTTL